MGPYQWGILILSGLGLLAISPYAKTTSGFFSATNKFGKHPGVWAIALSLVITWLQAKSITNTADLTFKYGWAGGLAYSVYYIGFLVAGFILFGIRKHLKVNSLPEFIRGRFGEFSVRLFALLIGIRLFNEVWSNTIVIGSYFGEQGSGEYYFAILIFTLLTLLYSLKGGFRSSLITDVIQMGLFGLFLSIILFAIFPNTDYSIQPLLQASEKGYMGGFALMGVAFIQLLSYPFHDPVLTDRAFLSDPSTAKKAFLYATPIGIACIMLFGFIGSYSRMNGGDIPAAVSGAQILGPVIMLVVNAIMVSSAASTLDSTFFSFAKLSTVDLKKKITPSIRNARIAMIAVTVIGTLPVFLDPKVISATTISGTMVLGLTPIFVFWKKEAKHWGFPAAVFTGIAIAICSLIFPNPFHFTTDYVPLLVYNLIGISASILVYLPSIQWKTTI